MLPGTIGAAPGATATAIVLNAPHTQGIPEGAAAERIEGANAVGHRRIVAARRVVFGAAIAAPSPAAATTAILLHALDTQGIPFKKTAVIVEGANAEFHHEVTAAWIGMLRATITGLGKGNERHKRNQEDDEADCPPLKDSPYHCRPRGKNAGLQRRRPATRTT